MQLQSPSSDPMSTFIEPLVDAAAVPCAVRLGDGRSYANAAQPRFSLEFPNPHTLERLLRNGALADFADAYVEGDLIVSGDVEAAVGLVRLLRQALPNQPLEVQRAVRVQRSPRSEENEAQWVRLHYDLPTEFFRLFLGSNLVYSCAYFSEDEDDDDLERAQQRKLELSCRKLMLRPGDRLLDVGCGWGSLLFHAAFRFGVHAHGITLSPPQAEHVRQKARKLHVDHHVRARVQHYADLDERSFHKIVSIGMVEHVGVAKLPEYFATMHRVLKPGGLLLNHGITLPRGQEEQIGGEFIAKHVFPGSEIDDVGHMVSVMEDAGFEIVDVQSLRPHYGRTLRHWTHRYFQRRDRAARLVPQRVLRAWDIYLPSCADAFETGVLSVHQILAFKPDRSHAIAPPLTRERLIGAPDDLLDRPPHNCRHHWS